MTIQVTGTNLDVGSALRGYAIDRVEEAVSKYVDGALSGHVRIEKTRHGFETRCEVRLGWGLELQATGSAGDGHASVDTAVEHLDKRLRRHKRRLVSRHHSAPKAGDAAAALAMDYVLRGDDEGAEADADETASGPAIVAERQSHVLEHSVSDAVMALELAEAPCIMFRNAGSGRLNVVYRRSDGNIGWIDPGDDTAR